ncbi:FxsA family protein [Streptomyces sp. TRM66268-LWL]|uniref:FxsA family protein n=1 Tax=Streptomyces polyasparticus TaxID=2767826 RepID=A0ABR7SV37_9ACTN|nr:FxsA family membrane protein [Streptomyces polyasparticus]MBC9718510.1 FxsA family protein [Streptomyces polyasparticus]
MTTPPTARPAGRSKRLRFLPLGIAAWLVLEIWLLLQVAQATSGFVVFLLLLAGVVLGAYVIKRAGRRAFRSLSETLQQAQTAAAAGEPVTAPQTQQSRGNGLTMLAGLLLIMPGLLSDAIGLVCLLPPVRKAVARRAEKSFEKRLAEAGAGSFESAFQQARIHRPDGKVVQGEVIRDDVPGEPGPRRDDGPYPPITS